MITGSLEFIEDIFYDILIPITNLSMRPNLMIAI